MSVKDKKDLNEASFEVGGGATGVSSIPDPVGGKATLPASKNNSEPMKKLDQSRASMVASLVTYLSTLDKSALSNHYSSIIPAGAAASNKASIATKEDVADMFSGEELTEEFKEKATVIFEAALEARVTTRLVEIEEENEAKLAEEVAEMQEALISQVDAYLDHVVGEWMTENKLAVESSLRTEITEDFLSGLKALFEEHHIEIPEDKVDVVQELVDRVAELEEQINASINENIELKSTLTDKVHSDIIESLTTDMTDVQAEKFSELVSSVEASSPEEFTKKAEILKESFIARPAGTTTVDTAGAKKVLSEVKEETAIEEDNVVTLDPTISAYVNAIKKTSNK